MTEGTEEETTGRGRARLSMYNHKRPRPPPSRGTEGLVWWYRGRGRFLSAVLVLMVRCREEVWIIPAPPSRSHVVDRDKTLCPFALGRWRLEEAHTRPTALSRVAAMSECSDLG